jgi:hypothetical protein
MLFDFIVWFTVELSNHVSNPVASMQIVNFLRWVSIVESTACEAAPTIFTCQQILWG